MSRPGYSVWCNGGVSSHLCQRPVEAPSVWQESFTWNILRICIVRLNLERRHSNCRYLGIGKDGRIRNSSSKNQCKRSVNATKGEYFYIPNIADGTAKLSGIDYEFEEPTLRRKQTARSEDFSGEFEGEPGESSTDRINR